MKKEFKRFMLMFAIVLSLAGLLIGIYKESLSYVLGFGLLFFIWIIKGDNVI